MQNQQIFVPTHQHISLTGYSHHSAILLTLCVASVLGALLPALRAARLHPVEALRWE